MPLKLNKLITLLAFTVCSVCGYSQNILHRFDDIDFGLLNEIIKMADDSIIVNSTNAPFYFYNSTVKSKLFSDGYEIAYPFVGNTAIVKSKNSYVLIDKNGKVFFDSESPIVPKLSSYEKYVVLNEGKSIYELRTGERKSGFVYCAEPSTPDYFIANTKDNKYQLMDIKKKQPLLKSEMDTLFAQNFLLYNEQDLLIAKKNNKYGLFSSDGTEIQKIKYLKAKFLGKYIALNDGKNWNYYIFEDKKLKLILKSNLDCKTAVYQNNSIGVFVTKNNKYNMLKSNGEKLSKDFEFISPEGTYGIENNTLYIFNSSGNFYEYYKK